MAAIKLSQKLMMGYLAIILFVSLIVYYIQYSENTSNNAVVESMKILQSSESLATYNLQMFNAAQRFALYGSDYEHNQSISMFSAAQKGMISQISILKGMGLDKYSLGILETYLSIAETDFEKLTSIHTARHLSGNNSVMPGAGSTAEMDRSVHDVLLSLEDMNVKITGAREMIVEQTKKRQNDTLARHAEQERTSRYLLVIAVLFGIALSLLITRVVTKQITELRNGAQKIGQGDLNVRLDVSAHDELGDVAAAFNKMAEDLKKSTVGISELDVLVSKRTKELAEKNSELEQFNNFSVGRELKMIELKKKIRELEGEISSKKNRVR